jgi:hypothetical protein
MSILLGSGPRQRGLAGLTGLTGMRRVRHLRRDGVTSWAAFVETPAAADEASLSPRRILIRYTLTDGRVIERICPALHESVVIVSVETETVPHVDRSERVVVDDLGYTDDGIVRDLFCLQDHHRPRRRPAHVQMAQEAIPLAVAHVKEPARFLRLARPSHHDHGFLH